MANNNLREEILKTLSKHPEGLTIMEIAEKLGKHRHTITKYIYELTGAGQIKQREIGSAKLCYLRESG
jgi:DNA-binding IclR family transcriptional regulator